MMGCWIVILISPVILMLAALVWERLFLGRTLIEVLGSAPIVGEVEIMLKARGPLTLGVAHREVRVCVSQVLWINALILTNVGLMMRICFLWGRSSSECGSFSLASIRPILSWWCRLIVDLRFLCVNRCSVLTLHLSVLSLVMIHLSLNPWLDMLILHGWHWPHSLLIVMVPTAWWTWRNSSEGLLRFPPRGWKVRLSGRWSFLFVDGLVLDPGLLVLFFGRTIAHDDSSFVSSITLPSSSVLWVKVLIWWVSSIVVEIGLFLFNWFIL